MTFSHRYNPRSNEDITLKGQHGQNLHTYTAGLAHRPGSDTIMGQQNTTLFGADFEALPLGSIFYGLIYKYLPLLVM